MTPVEEVRAAIDAFEDVRWSLHDEPDPAKTDDGEGIGWVNFEVEKSELGWRIIEFLAWALNGDLKHAGFQLLFTPFSPSPYHNDPGECLSYLLEMVDDPAAASRGGGIRDIARFINQFRIDYWDDCKP